MAGDIGYDKLLIATGATPLRPGIAGADLPGVHCLHSLADAQALRQAAAGARRAVIVGGSFIGLELASSLTQMGVQVMLIQKQATSIIYGERVHNDVMTRELAYDFRKLVDELMRTVEPDAAVRIKESARYMQLMGDETSITGTRIAREAREGEPSSRDYAFSRASIERNIRDGYQLAMRAIKH